MWTNGEAQTDKQSSYLKVYVYNTYTGSPGHGSRKCDDDAWQQKIRGRRRRYLKQSFIKIVYSRHILRLAKEPIKSYLWKNSLQHKHENRRCTVAKLINAEQ